MNKNYDPTASDVLITTSKTASEQASASVGPMERRHPKLEALDAAAQDVFDNEGEITDRLIDQYSKAYNALADDLDAQARQIAALRAALEQDARHIHTLDHHTTRQRITFEECPSAFCSERRAALEEPQGEAQ